MKAISGRKRIRTRETYIVYYNWVILDFVFVSCSADCKGFKVEHPEICSFLIKWLLVERDIR